MTVEDRLLLLVFAILTAMPGLFFRHNQSVYETARNQLSQFDGPFLQLRRVQSWVLHRVSRRIVEAVEQLGRPGGVLSPTGVPLGGVSVDETIKRILAGSDEDLGTIRELRLLRDRRRKVVARVRDLANFLRWYVLVAAGSVPLAAIAYYWMDDKRPFTVPGLLLLAWLVIQAALYLRQRQEDNITDESEPLFATYTELN